MLDPEIRTDLTLHFRFYDARGDIMAAAELTAGPSGGDVFDLDIADENRILPIVFNFVLAFHTIGVRRSKLCLNFVSVATQTNFPI